MRNPSYNTGSLRSLSAHTYFFHNVSRLLQQLRTPSSAIHTMATLTVSVAMRHLTFHFDVGHFF